MVVRHVRPEVDFSKVVSEFPEFDHCGARYITKSFHGSKRVSFTLAGLSGGAGLFFGSCGDLPAPIDIMAGPKV